VLATLDVFGYPLCRDNYSTAELVLQEAMLAGVPPVVLPYGGAARSVIHDVTGIVAQNESEYVRAVEHLHAHPEERARLGRNAQVYAREEFAPAKTAGELVAACEQLMTRPKREHRFFVTNRPSSGAEWFITALGDQAEIFRTSLESADTDTILAAESQIAQASPVLRGALTGGIRHYRKAFPDDPHLRLWTALTMEQEGILIAAVGEYGMAQRLGLDHWRVDWYASRAAEKAGLHTIARERRAAVVRAAPSFAQAQRPPA
jgi:hypothetical protein